MIVLTAQRGGSFREPIAMAKAYVEARRQHGESELLGEIVAAKHGPIGLCCLDFCAASALRIKR